MCIQTILYSSGAPTYTTFPSSPEMGCSHLTVWSMWHGGLEIGAPYRVDALKKERKESIDPASLSFPYVLGDLKGLWALGRGWNYKMERAWVTECNGKTQHNMASHVLGFWKVSLLGSITNIQGLFITTIVPCWPLQLQKIFPPKVIYSFYLIRNYFSYPFWS